MFWCNNNYDLSCQMSLKNSTRFPDKSKKKYSIIMKQTKIQQSVCRELHQSIWMLKVRVGKTRDDFPIKNKQSVGWEFSQSSITISPNKQRIEVKMTELFNLKYYNYRVTMRRDIIVKNFSTTKFTLVNAFCCLLYFCLTNRTVSSIYIILYD